MSEDARFFGLDVHKDSSQAVAKLVKKQGDRETLSFCYEAGPTGYVLYWQLVRLGVSCVVIAPTLIPGEGQRPGEDGSPRRREARAMFSCR